eukprot:2065879-Amphidinium_carterae.1
MSNLEVPIAARLAITCVRYSTCSQSGVAPAFTCPSAISCRSGFWAIFDGDTESGVTCHRTAIPLET